VREKAKLWNAGDRESVILQDPLEIAIEVALFDWRTDRGGENKSRIAPLRAGDQAALFWLTR
jgi:hypothetical protein